MSRLMKLVLFFVVIGFFAVVFLYRADLQENAVDEAGKFTFSVFGATAPSDAPESETPKPAETEYISASGEGAGLKRDTESSSETDRPEKEPLYATAEQLANATKMLYLVNKEYMLDDEDEPELESVLAYNVIDVARSSIELEPTALYALKDWFEAAELAGHYGLYCTSGKRTAEYQKQLYDNSADKSFVQPPGASEHQTGLAADIASTRVNWNDMGTSELGSWLAENCADFGYILRYPEDKTEITEISYEPWHFRYVGYPHSFYIQENNLCYEEYLIFLEESGGYESEINGTRYSVNYYSGENVIIPEDALSFELSGDNKGGYIITAIIQGD